MKRQSKFLFIGVLLATVALWSCSKNDGSSDHLNLQQSLNKGAFNLNKAVDIISSTPAYTLFTTNDGLTKSATETASDYRVYITLDTVKGVWDYKPVPKKDRWGWSLMKYFTRTADNEKMIVNMPLKKVEHPRALRYFIPADTALKNNFKIAVSDYHNNYNCYWDFDYLLKSEISINDTLAGKLNIDYLVNPATGVDYASQYAFEDGYTADYKYLSGDTTVSSFGISKDNKILYEEKRLTMKNDTLRFGREHLYILTIGDVQITRKWGWHSAKIYLKGVEQTNAVIEIIDNDQNDHEASVCKKRDIKITFDDGTTATLSTLIGSSVENIKTIFNSLHEVYFAAAVVDWIAYDIYYKRN
jgi:hypothetical protein